MSSEGKTKSAHKTDRFMELEGLRGIAAIMVVAFHFLTIFYGVMFARTAVVSVQHMRLEDNLYGNPISALISGVFAVAIFFVLSGFVLSIGFFQTKNIQIIKDLAAKRYLRLMIPAFASLILCFLLLSLGLSRIQESAIITQSGWEAGVWAFTPNFIEVIKAGVYGIFVENGNAYNGVLWTMTTEFVGSFLVFGTLLIFAKSRFRWVIYIALLGLTLHTWFLGFIIGMALADMYASGFFKQKHRNLLSIAIILAVGLYLGGYPFESLTGTAYQIFDSLKVIGVSIDRALSVTIGAAILVFLVIWAAQLAKVLRHRYISILGKYTFSLYLMHMPIIYTFTAGLFIFLHQYMGYNRAVALSFVATIPVVWFATVVFEKYIDKKSVKLSSYCADIYFGRRNLPKLQVLVNIKGYALSSYDYFRYKWNVRFNLKPIEEELE
jgi:peptidoglycan/LPS O-acetylase OafA/YrhL